MIRISVVSTRDVVRKSIKIISIVVLLIVIIYIVKFSNKHLNKIELNSKMALSYISEEITMLGDFNDIDFSRVYPEQILSKELGFSYVSKHL